MDTPISSRASGSLKSEQVPPTADDVRAQLSRILESPEFPKTGRSAAFLSYIVEETLQGRGPRLKGYSIAIEVFKRNEQFSQDDPIVRIEAGRLRRGIERYYLVAGHDDPVRIDVPKGGYLPIFTWNERKQQPEPADLAGDQELQPRKAFHFWPSRWVNFAAYGAAILFTAAVTFVPTTNVFPGLSGVAAATPGQPTLVVAPFANLGGGDNAELYARGLTDELLTALPRFREIKVSGRETSKTLSPAVEGSHVRDGLGARFLLAGGVRVSDTRVRVSARLLDTSTNEILWSHIYDDDVGTRELFAIQVDVADKVASAVAQPFGIITRVNASRPPPEDFDAYRCTLDFYSYRADMRPDNHAFVRNCLETAVAGHPDYATAWAMLSITYLDESRFRFNPRAGAPTSIERALLAAQTAVRLDQNDIRAQQALMMTLYFSQRLDEALRIGHQALLANPNDTEFMGEFGFRLALSGQWQEGADLMDKSIALNPGGADFYYGVRALAAYMLGDIDNAVIMIRKATVLSFPMMHIMASAIYAEAGLMEEAKQEGAIFMQTRPDYVHNIVAELKIRNIGPSDRIRMISSLRKAGLPVPADTLVDGS